MNKPLSSLQIAQISIAANAAVENVRVSGPNELSVIAASQSRKWRLAVTPGEEFGLPRIRILESELIGKLAHVNYVGTVCYTDHEGLSIDETQDAAVADYALSNALAVLEKSHGLFASESFEDLTDEMEGFWYSLPNGIAAELHCPLGDKVREVLAVVHDQNCLAFVEHAQLKNPKYDGLRRLASLPRRRAIYLPLQHPVLPPAAGESPASQRMLKDIDQALSPECREQLTKLLKSWPKKNSEVYVLISQPRSDGSKSAFGLQWIGKSDRHPLIERSSTWKVRPLVVHRHSADHLLPRGGGEVALAKSRVLVLGCGSVGSRIIEHLLLAGIGKITALDKKVLRPDNLFRHLLGGAYCGIHKALGLSTYFAARLPNANVVPVDADAREWVTPEKLKQFDAIVVAIGVPHIERALARTIRRSSVGVAMITTWLEPLSLGGHAHRSIPHKPGCVECLYTHVDGASNLNPKIGFAEPNQNISQNFTGCAGSFTPYTALDATQTALLATRLVTAYLLGDQTTALNSWRGDGAAFQAAGFRTTHWFNTLDGEKLRIAASNYARVPCPTCGGIQ